MASRRRAVLRRLIIGVLTLFGGAVPLWGWMIGSYLKADTEYQRLMARKPKTRAEVESVLTWWPHRRIEKSQSDYGRWTAITGRYEQYSVFGAPIDVVYDESDRVVVILPSYE